MPVITVDDGAWTHHHCVALPSWNIGRGRPPVGMFTRRRWFQAGQHHGLPEGHQTLVLAEDSNFPLLAEIAVTVAVYEYGAAVGAAVAVGIPQEEGAYGLSK